MEFGSKFVFISPGGDEDEIILHDEKVEKLAINKLKIRDGDGDVCMLDILDTAGQAEYSALREKYMKESQAFVIVYAINDTNSFKEALDMHEFIKRVRKTDKFPAVLCGNKLDLETDREVDKLVAEKEAKARDVPFLETSAKSGVNVKEAFEQLIRMTPRRDIHYKITVLGSGGVGKSSIVIRFTQDSFITNYDPTIEDTFRKTITVQGIPPSTGLDLHSDDDEDVWAFGLPSSSSQGYAAKSREDEFAKVAVMAAGAVRSYIKLSNSSTSSTLHKTKKADGNIILVSLGTLEDDPKIMTGDAISCIKCSAILSHVSTVVSSGSSEDGTKKVWKCDFCDNQNELEISPEEIPKEAAVDFLVEAVSSQQEPDDALDSDKPNSRAGVVIYCIDVSSSMGEKSAQPLLQAEWYALRGNRVASISRLHCIKQAVKRQLDYYEIETPEKAVGVVTFGSTINFICDKPEPTNINFGKTQTLEDLLKIGEDLAQKEKIKSLNENAELVKSRISTLRLNGRTALGPALAVSVGFLRKTPGSEIVLCTDGEPNLGIGSLPRDSGFYEKIGEIAKSQQTTISVIGIQTGKDYNMETVSTAAAITGGTINLLNPHELSHKLREITQDTVVATNVTVTVLLHPNFSFVSEKADISGRSVASCSLGNVHKKSEMTFRFQVKKDCEISEAYEYPFQVQIRYCTKDGRTLLRVLTEKRMATKDRDKMEKDMNIPVVGATAMSESAKIQDVRARRLHLNKNLHMAHNYASRSKAAAESYCLFEDAAVNMSYDVSSKKCSYQPPGAMLPRSTVKSSSFLGGYGKLDAVRQKPVPPTKAELHRKKFYSYEKNEIPKSPDDKDDKNVRL